MTLTSKWWQNSVVYQVYPKSFKDTTGTGVGDLNGIREKLPYLSNLGIDVIWLNPIFESPMIDNGYDISDYYEINKDYGTLEDFKELLASAHNNEIKIITDLVVNHTSDQHQWFQKSKSSRDNPYSDYYIWKDPKPDGSAPNNWMSSFGGPAWTYVEERDQYYLHLFAKEQPDLNWENAEMRFKIYEMMKYWFELGLDGFRLDVINLISKNQDFPDSPPDNPDTKNYYIGTSHGPRIHEFLKEMNEEVFSKYDVMTVGETPNTNVNQAILYTDPNNHELNMVFHFEHMHLDYGKYGKFSDVRFKLSDLKKVLSRWQTKLDAGWNSLYWSNHDQPRAVTRFGCEGKYRVESAKMLGTLLHMMRGTPYIYQGEELGMKNLPVSELSEYDDLETIDQINLMRKNGESEDFIKKSAYLKSRDNSRMPFPWNSREDEGYGFSESEPWLLYSTDNSYINAEDALNDEDSVFYHYQKLIKLRKKYPIITKGNYKELNVEDSDIFSYVREYEDEQLLIICSFSQYKINYELPSEFKETSNHLLLSNYSDSPSVLTDNFLLRPYEALVFRIKDC